MFPQVLLGNFQPNINSILTADANFASHSYVSSPFLISEYIFLFVCFLNFQHIFIRKHNGNSKTGCLALSGNVDCFDCQTKQIQTREPIKSIRIASNFTKWS